MNRIGSIAFSLYWLTLNLLVRLLLLITALVLFATVIHDLGTAWWAQGLAVIAFLGAFAAWRAGEWLWDRMDPEEVPDASA